MRLRHVAWLLLLVVGCKMPLSAASKGAARSAKPSPSAKPQASAAGWTTTKRDALVAALDDMAAGGRAARVTGAVREAAGIISNNGLSLLSNNGAGIISDNGLGYRVLAAAPTIVETESLVYVIAVGDDETGEFRTYDKALYHKLADVDRAKAEVDHFTIDKVETKLVSQKPPLTLAATYHLTMVSSTRLPFAKQQGLTAKQTYALTPVGEDMTQTLVGWEIAFDMDVPLIGGKTRRSSFTAVAGQDDIALYPGSDGDMLGIPKLLALTGSNEVGRFEGRMSGADYPVTELTFTADATQAVTRQTQQTQADGSTTRAIELEAIKLRLTTTQAADGTGTGQLLDLASASPRPIGTLVWTEDGIGTVTVTDGNPPAQPSTFKVRLF